MVENWIDTNKYGDGNDKYLCWGAAIANALSFTHLVDASAEDIYDFIRSESNLQRHWVVAGINAVFRYGFQRIPPFECFKILPPPSMWVLNEMEARGGCAILCLTDENFQNGHVLTAYATELHNNFSSDDVRSIDKFIYTDSDDTDEIGEPFYGLQQMSIEYDVRKKIIKTDYYDMILRYAVLVMPRS